MAGIGEKIKNFYKREWQNERAREANKVRCWLDQMITIQIHATS